MTTYGLTNQEIMVWLHTGARVFSSPKHSGLASGHIQPPIGRHRSCFLGSTVSDVWRQSITSIYCQDKEWVELYLHCRICLQGVQKDSLAGLYDNV